MATASVTNSFTNSTTADANEVNTNFADLVTFLNGSVVHVDGSKAMTAALPMGSNKITGLANGTVATDAAAFGQLPAKPWLPVVFGKSGVIDATTTTSSRWYVPTGKSYTIMAVVAGLDVDPLTTAVWVDVHKNGTTIFTTQTNQPRIAVAAFSDAADAIEVSALTGGDYLESVVDQADSGGEAAGLNVTVFLQEA